MEYKETYDKFWKMNDSEFKDYGRNLLLEKFFPAGADKSVADIAGGSGIVASWLQNRGYKVCLVEFSDRAIEKAKTKGILNIVKFEFGKDKKLPMEDNSFDCVFFGDIIEHLFDPEGALKEMKRILKPDGKLIISCPNMAYWRFRLYYCIDGDFQRIDVAKQKPWEQEHIRFYNIKILKDFLAKLDFPFVKFCGFNNIWHSRFLARKFPNLFAHTIVVEFINKK